MTKGKVMGKIFGIALVFVLIGATLGCSMPTIPPEGEDKGRWGRMDLMDTKVR